MPDTSLSSTRAYPAVSGRQQSVDRLVRDTDDLRRALTLAALTSSPLNARLAARLLVDSPITIPAGVPLCQINGGNTFGVDLAGDVSSVFQLEGAQTELLLGDSYVRSARGYVANSLVAFVDADNVVNDAISPLRVRNVDVDSVTYLLDPAGHWSRVSVVDLRTPSGAQVAISDADGGSIRSCNFLSVLGQVSVTLHEDQGSGYNNFTNVGTADNAGAVTSTGGDGEPNTFIGCSFTTIAIRPVDLYFGFDRFRSDPSFGIFVEDDFIGSPSSLTGSSFGELAWRLDNSGTGAAISTSTATDGSHVGVWSIATGSTSTGRCAFNLATSGIVLGGGRAECEWLVQVPALSTVVDEFVCRVGINDTSNGTNSDAVDGVYFVYDRATNGANWQARTSSASSRTTVDTGVAVTAGAWVKLRAVVNAAATSVSFFVDNALVATITTNIPVTGTCLLARIDKTAGTNTRTLLTDYVTFSTVFSTPR